MRYDFAGQEGSGLVRPQKPIDRSATRTADQRDNPSRHKGRYFETPVQRLSKYEWRPTTVTPPLDDDAVGIVIDLREVSEYIDEPRTEHYYERFGPRSE
jgi:hypothetical protein